MNRIFIVIGLLLLSTASFGQKTKQKTIKTMPQLSLYDLKGKATDLKTMGKGKVTFIDFWFIPCGPCFVEMNMLHQLHAKYKDNPNVCFTTITITDSSFVRPLAENRNTATNKTYDYFKRLADLDTFKLPVYFIKNTTQKKTTDFDGRGVPRNQDPKLLPNYIFGFSGYPTIFIFDKKGNVIYKKTGFTKDGEKQQQTAIEKLINAHL